MSGWRPAPNVAWVDAGDFLADDDSIYALVLPDGDPLVLRGPAALGWEAALAGGDLVGDVAAASGRPRVGRPHRRPRRPAARGQP